MTFVDYVRDRGVADLHVLVTTQSTGGGGSAWIVKFIGLQRFLGLDRTLTFTTSPTATSDERRREFGRIFRLGLVAYAADTPVAPKLDVTLPEPAADAGRVRDRPRPVAPLGVPDQRVGQHERRGLYRIRLVPAELFGQPRDA